MLTAREVMKALSKVHPDTPVVVRMERLHYDSLGQLKLKETEVDQVPVSAVKDLLDGRVEIA